MTEKDGIIIETKELIKAWKCLKIKALGLGKGIGGTIDGGISIEDLPQEVIVAFLESPNLLGWDPKKGNLVTFLSTLMKRRLIDHLRRQKFLVEDDVDGFEQKSVNEKNKFSNGNKLRLELERLVKGRKDEKELLELIEAAECIEEDGGIKISSWLSYLISAFPKLRSGRKN